MFKYYRDLFLQMSLTINFTLLALSPCLFLLSCVLPTKVFSSRPSSWPSAVTASAGECVDFTGTYSSKVLEESSLNCDINLVNLFKVGHYDCPILDTPFVITIDQKNCEALELSIANNHGTQHPTMHKTTIEIGAENSDAKIRWSDKGAAIAFRKYTPYGSGAWGGNASWITTTLGLTEAGSLTLHKDYTGVGNIFVLPIYLDSQEWCRLPVLR